jgi:DNA repair exonuclease SbcCD ATPase subunit
MAVTIESLHFENAFTYRDCTMPLADQGLVYLNGRNGHGKSTPFETLQHILYGTTSRGVRKDGIACAVPGAGGFLGEVVLMNPDGRWLVRQSRNHHRHKTSVTVLKWVEGKWSTRWEGGGSPKKMDDAQKLAASLLGLQLHEFSGCMYLSQAGAHTLIEGTPGEKMKYVAQLFGLDVCDRMIVWLRDRLKQAERETVDVPVLEARRAQLQQDHDDYDVPRAEDIACMESARQVGAWRKGALQDRIYEARDRLANQRNAAELQRQRQKLGEVGDADALKQRHGKLQDRHAALQRYIETAEVRADIEEQLADLPAVDSAPEQLEQQAEQLRCEIADLDQLIRQLDDRQDLQERLDQLPAARSLAGLQTVIPPLEQQHHVTEANLKAKKSEALQLRETIASCQAGECPTCHRSLDIEQMWALVTEVERAAADLDEKVQQSTVELMALQEERRRAEQRDRLGQKLSELPDGDAQTAQERLGAARDRYRGVRDALAACVDRAALRGRLDALPAVDLGVDEARQKLQRIETLLGGVTTELQRAAMAEGLDRQLDAIQPVDVEADEAFCAAAEAELQRVDEAVAVVQDRLTRAQVAQDDYAALTRDLQDTAAELERLAEPRRRVHVLNYSVAATQKLKRRKLHQVIESVRDCLPRFASTMFSHEPNTRFVVSSDDESLDLVCRRRVDGAGVDVPVKSLSGGEKQRLSVALVFTLHALLHARKRPDLLILDEVDRGLDEVGIASLMSLVRGVRQQYGTVIMTSHRAQIAGAAFDRTWTVTKQDETSQLRTDGGSECSA